VDDTLLNSRMVLAPSGWVGLEGSVRAIQTDRKLTVGDTRADKCMIRRACLDMAFIPKDDDVRNVGENVNPPPDMMHVIRLLDAAP